MSDVTNASTAVDRLADTSVSTGPSQTWTYVKWGVILAVVLYIFTSIMQNLPQLSSLVKNIGVTGKAFGSMWIIFSVLSAMLPILAGVLQRLFNKGLDMKKQAEAVEEISSAASKANDARADPLDNAKVEEIAAEALKDMVEQGADGFTPESIERASSETSKAVEAA